MTRSWKKDVSRGSGENNKEQPFCRMLPLQGHELLRQNWQERLQGLPKLISKIKDNDDYETFFTQSIVATWYVDSRNSFQRWLEISFVFLNRMVRLISPEAATSFISLRRLTTLLRRTRIQERVLRFCWSRHKLVDHNPEF